MISYSRRDKAFVQQLEQALRATGREIWVDWLDIPPTVDFLQEIYAGIEAANTFIFVISPDSAKSEVCGMEVEHAVKFNKRIVPVIYRDLTPEELAKLHPAVASHNWIYVREQDNFNDSLKTLVSALETDLTHVQMHTKLLVLAREWESEGRSSGFLLRGAGLKDAEIWLTSGVDRKPEATALQAEYIATSRKAAARTRQIIVGALSAALVIVSLLALVAFQQSGVANAALGISNQRGTDVAYQNATAVAALTDVQERENLRATAQQDAANSLEQANANATLSSDNAATAANSLLTAIAAQNLADTNLSTATAAQGQAQDALATANSAQASANVAQATASAAQATGAAAQGTAQAAQGTAQANLETANAAQSTADAAQATANAALAAAQAAQGTASAANAQAAAAQAAANAASTDAAVKGTQAANAQAAANAAGTDAAVKGTAAAYAQQTAAAAQKAASYEQTRAATAQIAAAIAEATAEVEQTHAAVEAGNAQSLSLASQAQSAVIQRDRPLAMSLALLANVLPDDPPADSATILRNIAASVGERYTLDTSVIRDIQSVAIAGSSPATMRVMAGSFSHAALWNISNDATASELPSPEIFDQSANQYDQIEVGFSPDGNTALVNHLVTDEVNINPLIYIYSFVNGHFQKAGEKSLPDNLQDIPIHPLYLLYDNQTFFMNSFGNGYKSSITDMDFKPLNTVWSHMYSILQVGSFFTLPGDNDNKNNPFVYSLSRVGQALNGMSPVIVRWRPSEPTLGEFVYYPNNNWLDVDLPPANQPYLLYIALDNLGIYALGFANYSYSSEGFVLTNDQLISLSAQPSVVSFKLDDPYPADGDAAAVVGLKNGKVTVLDMPVNVSSMPVDDQGLINWVCHHRYWQYLVNGTKPANITDEMLQKMVARCDNALDPGTNPVSQSAALSALSISPLRPNEPVLPSETPTPDIMVTPSETPTPDPNTPQLIDSSDPQVSLTGSWQPIENPQANGGSYFISSTADDSMGLIFEGTAISIIYFQHPAMGSFNVEIDGVLKGSVRETGDTILFRQVPISGLTPGIHTLRLVPARNPIVIDAFVVNPPINWLPGTIATATPSPTLDVTLTPTASWTPSLTPEILLDTPTPTPMVVLTELSETETPMPTYIGITETLTPTETLTDVPTWTATLQTPIWTDTPTAMWTVTVSETPTVTVTITDMRVPVPTSTEATGEVIANG